MSVSQFAQTDVVTADRDTAASDLAGEMRESDVGSVVIVEESEPVGIVTDRQLALALADGGDLSGTTASELMTEDLITVSAENNVFEVVETFDEESVRRLPMVGEDGELAGIVSLDDVVVMLSVEFGHVSDVIEAQSPRF